MAQDLETAAPHAGAGGGAGALPDGHRLAGRFVLEGTPRRSPFGLIYTAQDEQTGHPVSVHVLDPRLAASPGVADAVLGRAGELGAFDHKHVARTVASGRDGGAVYVATELLEGHTLRELLARKKSTGGAGFGARGTSNIISAVISAIGAATPRGHTALTLDAVYVNRAGRVKVADFALAPAAPAALAAGLLPAGSLASDRNPAIPADVHALGRMVYELLVGQPLARGGPRPSEVEAVGPEIDELIARCCLADPDKRPTDLDKLRAEMMEGFKGRRSGGGLPAASVPLAAPSASGSFPGLAAGSSSPSLAQAIHGGRMSGQQAAATPVADADEKWLISKGKLDFGPFTLAHVMEDIRTNQILPGHVIVDKDTGERCKVEKHPLLHDLIDQAKQRRDDERRAQAEVAHSKQESRRGKTLYAFIAAGVVAIGLGVFLIIRMLGSDKFHPSLSVQGEAGAAKIEYVVIAFTDEGRKGKRSEAAATSKGPAALTDKNFVRIKWPKISGAVAYEVYRVSGGDDALGTGRIAAVDADTLSIDDTGLEGDGTTPEVALQGVKELQGAELQAKISFPEPPRREARKGGGSRGHRAGSSGGSGGGGGPLDLSEEGGDEILDQGQINSVIQRNGSRLARCLLSKGASRADIEFSVAGSGRVSRVEVYGANGAATSCIQGVIRSMRFPSFKGTFTNARFDMSI